MRYLFLFLIYLTFLSNPVGAADLRPLISVEELDTQNSIILEVSTDVQKQTGHIPNARLTNFFKDGWVKNYPGLPGMLPEPADFNKTLSKLGLNTDEKIVLVSCSNSLTNQAATARIFWSLRVYGFQNLSILNGGLETYLKQNQPSILKPHFPEKMEISVSQTKKNWITDYNNVYAGEDYGTPVIDTRDYGRARGEEVKHPLAQRSGKIFDAEIIPASLHLKEGVGTYKSKEEILSLYSDVWGAPPGPIILYSDTGLRAAVSWFAIKEIAGQKDVRLYDGGYLEWEALGHEVYDETDDMGGPIGG